MKREASDFLSDSPFHTKRHTDASWFKEMLAQLRNPGLAIAKDFEVVKGGKLAFVRFMRLFVPVDD